MATVVIEGLLGVHLLLRVVTPDRESRTGTAHFGGQREVRVADQKEAALHPFPRAGRSELAPAAPRARAYACLDRPIAGEVIEFLEFGSRTRGPYLSHRNGGH